MVITVDDRNATKYLNELGDQLSQMGVRSHSMHLIGSGVREFRRREHVTLSTVHKAKGNEAFMVYIIGVDALFVYHGVRVRNMLFTAITRAKAWVRISGVGPGAKQCKYEVAQAKKHFPRMRFEYPGPDELQVMKRDLEVRSQRQQEILRNLQEAQEELEPAVLKSFLEKLEIVGNKSKGNEDHNG